MKNKIFKIILTLLFLSPTFCYALDSQNQEMPIVIEKIINEKSKLTGTLDFFDEKENRVRNLKLLKVIDEKETQAQAEFRDNSSGDIVTVNFILTKDNGQLTITKMTITDIKPNVAKVSADTIYTDAQIQEVMTTYIIAKSQFTETFDIFDEAKNQMRKLKLITLDPAVRRYGTTLISTGTFTDTQTQQEVKIDITVENNNGELSVQGVRFK